jgi:hypothetical protein
MGAVTPKEKYKQAYKFRSTKCTLNQNLFPKKKEPTHTIKKTQQFMK